MKLQSAHIAAVGKKWWHGKSWPALGEDMSPRNHFKYLSLSLWAPMSLTILVGRTYLLYKHNGKLSQKRFQVLFVIWWGSRGGGGGAGRRERLEGKMKKGKDDSPDFCILDIPFLLPFSLTKIPPK